MAGRLPHEVHEAIMADFRRGDSFAVVRARYGISPATATRWRQRAGIPPLSNDARLRIARAGLARKMTNPTWRANWSALTPRKLSVAQRSEIKRRWHAEPRPSVAQIAQEYGVSRTRIYQIVQASHHAAE